MASAGTAYVDVEAGTDDVASAIESALSSVDGTVEAVVEAGCVDSAVRDRLVGAPPVDVPVDADVETAQSRSTGLTAVKRRWRSLRTRRAGAGVD